MQALSLLFLLLVASGLATAASGVNPLSTPSNGWDVTAGTSYALKWDDQSDGNVSIYLVPYNTGIGGVWEDKVDIGLDNIANSGSATAHIAKNVSTDDDYIFTLVDLTRFDASNSVAWPADNSTNDSSAFRVNGPKKSGHTTQIIVGAVVGGVFGLALFVFVIYLMSTRKSRRDKNETADLTWFPFPHRDMRERQSRIANDPEAPRTPTKTISSSEMTSPVSDVGSNRRVSPRDMTSEKTTPHQAPPPPWALRGHIDHEVDHDADH